MQTIVSPCLCVHVCVSLQRTLQQTSFHGKFYEHHVTDCHHAILVSSFPDSCLTDPSVLQPQVALTRRIANRGLTASNVGQVVGYPNIFSGPTELLQPNSETVRRLGNDRFLPNPSLFITYQSAQHLTVCSLIHWPLCKVSISLTPPLTTSWKSCTHPTFIPSFPTLLLLSFTLLHPPHG